MKSVVLACCLAVAPGTVFAQHRTGGETFSGTPATASGGSSGSSSGSSGSSSSSSGGGETAVFAGTSGGGVAAAAGHRPVNIIVPSNSGPANTSSGAFTNYSNLSFPAPEFARPRGSVPVSSPAPGNGGITFIVGSYNPWNYLYGGLYATPLTGYYDPFDFDFGFPVAPLWTPSTSSSTTPSEKGTLNLDVKPRGAEVYIDGGLVGQAKQFGGVFHRLRLDAGVHRLELRAPGYQPLSVNVRIQAGESMTYHGALEKNVK